MGDNLCGTLYFRGETHILAVGHVAPALGFHTVSLNEDAFLVEVSQFLLGWYIATDGRCLHIHQCLVVVDRHAITIHIAGGQSILGLGMALTGSTLEPHRCRAIVF